MGKCARHKLREEEWRRGNARTKGTNWTKFTEIRTKFVRNPYEFRTNFVQISHFQIIHTNLFTCNSYEIRTNFIRISYEFHVNFVQFAKKQRKHTSKHTLHSPGHVMLHAPVFAHLGDRHAGAVFARCHSVVGRSWGGQCRSWRSGSPTPHRHCPPCTPLVGARCPRRTACTARRPR